MPFQWSRKRESELRKETLKCKVRYVSVCDNVCNLVFHKPLDRIAHQSHCHTLSSIFRHNITAEAESEEITIVIPFDRVNGVSHNGSIDRRHHDPFAGIRKITLDH